MGNCIKMCKNANEISGLRHRNTSFATNSDLSIGITDIRTSVINTVIKHEGNYNLHLKVNNYFWDELFVQWKFQSWISTFA